MVCPMAARPPAEEVTHTNPGVNALRGGRVSLLRPARPAAANSTLYCAVRVSNWRTTLGWGFFIIWGFI